MTFAVNYLCYTPISKLERITRDSETSDIKCLKSVHWLIYFMFQSFNIRVPLFLVLTVTSSIATKSQFAFFHNYWVNISIWKPLLYICWSRFLHTSRFCTLINQFSFVNLKFHCFYLLLPIYSTIHNFLVIKYNIDIKCLKSVHWLIYLPFEIFYIRQLYLF